jgi:hypothetical protein
MSAVQKVFNTGEVLRKILSYLERVQEIVVASGVCKAWNDWISDHPQGLRQRAFDDQTPRLPVQSTPKYNIFAMNGSVYGDHFARFLLSNDRVLFVLEKDRQKMWVSGSRDGSKPWYMIEQGTLHLARILYIVDGKMCNDVVWRSESGVVVWKMRVFVEEELGRYLASYHTREIRGSS